MPFPPSIARDFLAISSAFSHERTQNVILQTVDHFVHTVFHNVLTMYNVLKASFGRGHVIVEQEIRKSAIPLSAPHGRLSTMGGSGTAIFFHCCALLLVLSVWCRRAGASVPAAFSVDTGPCKASGACVSSSNYPGDVQPVYAANEACSITVREEGYLRVVHFDTEEEHDTLTVGSHGKFSGTAGPRSRNVTAGQQITWRSDLSEQKSGWSICIAPPAVPCAATVPWCSCKSGTGTYTLSANCALTAVVVVTPGATLHLATLGDVLASTGPAFISVGDATSSFSLFEVYGNLMLVDLVLTGGKSSLGGCLFVSGDARAHLVGTTIRRCTATSRGGAAYVEGALASLVLEGAILERNSAVGFGGGVYVGGAARMVVIASRASSSLTAVTILRNNTATMSGGGVVIQQSVLEVLGNGAHLLLYRNSAGSDGGAMLSFDGAAMSVSSGGVIKAKDNRAIFNGGGLLIHGKGTIDVVFVEGARPGAVGLVAFPPAVTAVFHLGGGGGSVGGRGGRRGGGRRRRRTRGGGGGGGGGLALICRRIVELADRRSVGAQR